MRLMDLLAHPGREKLSISCEGHRAELPDAGAYATSIRACPLRYVMDD